VVVRCLSPGRADAARLPMEYPWEVSMLLWWAHDRDCPTARRPVIYLLNVTNKAINDEYIVKFNLRIQNRRPLVGHGHLVGRVPARCGSLKRTCALPSAWCEAADRHPSNREFTTSRSSPCPLAGTPAPLHYTIIPHPKSFQRLELWPRRHAAQQHFTKRPHPIGQARGPRRRTGPPPFG
jgi:hypothetical protein